jgi:hypothetical protein
MNQFIVSNGSAYYAVCPVKCDAVRVTGGPRDGVG